MDETNGCLVHEHEPTWDLYLSIERNPVVDLSPISWTGLRTHRHRYELSGGAIAKCRMTPGSIVKHFHPFKHILPFITPFTLCLAQCMLVTRKHS
jgi:hypothetical protein